MSVITDLFILGIWLHIFDLTLAVILSAAQSWAEGLVMFTVIAIQKPRV